MTICDSCKKPGGGIQKYRMTLSNSESDPLTVRVAYGSETTRELCPHCATRLEDAIKSALAEFDKGKE